MTNHQINHEEVTAVDRLQFESLDRRYKSAHITGTILVYILLMALALLLLLTEWPWTCFAAETAIAVVGIINLALLPKAYRFKGYALREHDISYRTGVMFPKTTTIPFRRIQQVSVIQNPVARLFGLYSVEIVNGAQLPSPLIIPGLSHERANQIKNLVTERLRNDHD